LEEPSSEASPFEEAAAKAVEELEKDAQFRDQDSDNNDTQPKTEIMPSDSRTNRGSDASKSPKGSTSQDVPDEL